MPLPQRHQQKTKSKHRGCSLSASSLGICGWLGSPLLKVLPARDLSEGTYMEGGGSLPPGSAKLCPPSLQKGPHKEVWGADTLPTAYTSQWPNIWCRAGYSAPRPPRHPSQIFGRCCPIHKCFKIFTVLRFYSAFSYYILNLDKLFCLFLHVAMFFIKGRHCYSW